MWSWKRPTLSPYASMNQGRAPPDVTDDDYSYITSQDLQSSPSSQPEDDILLVKYRGRTEEAHFPAYSIGDGKLRVHDIRDRVGVMLDLPESQTRRVRLFYKGVQLKEPGALVRDYGVKNMSEILAMIRDDRDSADIRNSSPGRGSYGSEEDIPGAEDESSYGGSSVSGGTGRGSSSGKRRKGRKPKRKPAQPPEEAHVEIDPVHRAAQLEKLKKTKEYYDNDLAPLVLAYIRDPPADKGKSEEQHRRLTETILQQVVLKLDAVEPNGDEVIRSKRKALVRRMQDVMAELDEAKSRT
ncbi:uncharacterized protein DNG_01746 [Cephalotrichum gorgonifer]|uniref:BAG domain-containing protein n=1 Tax=Cephalotrichum gorgonifer TaxID=2041049 RepID=A0AAE8MRE6_9PEZI|nr:uncharacterized protein DNG_01746 [Cephalotrichum gorgonifer]